MREKLCVWVFVWYSSKGLTTSGGGFQGQNSGGIQCTRCELYIFK